MIRRFAVLLTGVAAVGLLTASLLTAYTFHTIGPWPSGSTVPMYLQLGTAPTTLSDGARSWDEVAACADPSDLVFTSDDVLVRVERNGDLFAPLLAGSPA